MKQKLFGWMMGFMLALLMIPAFSADHTVQLVDVATQTKIPQLYKDKLGDGSQYEPYVAVDGTVSGTFSGNITQLGGTNVDTNSGSKSAGTLRVTLATDQVQLTNALKVDGSAVTQPVSLTSWSSFPLTTLLTTTQTVSGSAGTLGGYALMNLNSSPAYIQVFDTTGAVTLGTTVPNQIFVIPANSTAANGVAANVEFGRGITMTNGIKIAATTTATGASTVGTGLSGTIFYK